MELHVKRAGSSGPDSLLYRSDRVILPQCWSPDGRWIVCITLSPVGGRPNLYGLLLGDSIRSVPLATGPFTEAQGAVSPDGKWLAYLSSESGEPEIYVQPFPGPGSKWRVSTTTGGEPSWRGDSREIYYLTQTSEMMAVAFTPGPMPKISPPHKLFDAPLGPPEATRNRYVVTRDGQRFLCVVPSRTGRVGATTIVLNWPDRLKAR